MRLSVAIAVTWLSISTLAAAGNAQAAVRKSTNIPAQTLGQALQTLAKDRGFQVVYLSDSVDSLKTQGAVGELTSEEALQRLLTGTGLSFRYLDESTVTIFPDPPSTSSKIHLTQADTGKTDHSNNQENTQTEASKDASVSKDESSDDGRDSSQNPRTAIPEILVSGSRSLNADIQRSEDDIQPYVVLDRRKIERSAATSVNDLLRSYLTMSYVPQANNQASRIGLGNQSTVALRGLSGAQTLVLVDGRRASSRGISGSDEQFDMNSIPLSAIERIEVLPTSASGIYGGGATGGVVNLVLRRDYKGVGGKVTLENSLSNDGMNRRLELNGGVSSASGKTKLTFFGSYLEADPLQAGDRRFVADYRARSFENIAASAPTRDLRSLNPITAATTNISAVAVFNPVTGQQVKPSLILKSGTSLNSPITYVPSGYAGYTSDSGAGLIANAGRYNLDLANTAGASTGLNASLLSTPRIMSLASTFRHEISPTVEVFLDASAASNRSQFDQNSVTATFLIPENSPTNPFSQRVLVSAPALGGDQTEKTKDETLRGVIGAIVRLPRDWRSEFDYSYDRYRFQQQLASSALDPLVNSAVTSGAINLFADQAIDFSPFLVESPRVEPAKSNASIATLRFGGRIGAVPAGDLTATFLLEYRKQAFGEFESLFPQANGSVRTVIYSPQSQTVASAYSEFRVPIVSESNRMLGLSLLELQIAGRFDRYRSLGGAVIDPSVAPPPEQVNSIHSFDPTIGIRAQPSSDVTFRASYATGFFPPRLNQIRPNLPRTFQPAVRFTDPRRGNEQVAPITLISGGNADLRPEESRSWSAGVILTPRLVPDLRISIDWTKIDKRDNVASIPPQQSTIDNESQLPGHIVRGPKQAGDPYEVGSIIGLDTALFNAMRGLSESYDFSFEYRRIVSGGWSAGLSVRATRLVHNQLQNTPLTSPIEYADSFRSPDWAGNATLDMSLASIDLNWSTRYLGSYWVLENHGFVPSQGSGTVPAVLYHDVGASYQFGRKLASQSALISNARVQLGIKNVFNKRPRYLSNSVNFYDPWGSPLMASYYLSLETSL